MGRAAHWTPVEIDVLTRSFLNTGEDAAIGTNQTGETFWGKVFETFKLEQPNTERNAGALEDKWHQISREVTEFNGLVQALVTANESGKNEEDLVKGALLAFKENKNNTINPKTKKRRAHEFRYLDSWRTMRGHPKWGKDGVNLAGKGFKRSLDSSGSLTSIDSERKRPAGRDKAKSLLFGNSKKSNALPLTEQFVRHSAKNGASLQQLARMAEDRNAMMLFSAQPNAPESQEFFAIMRSQYLARIKSRPSSSSPKGSDSHKLDNSVTVESGEGSEEFEDYEDRDFQCTDEQIGTFEFTQSRAQGVLHQPTSQAPTTPNKPCIVDGCDSTACYGYHGETTCCDFHKCSDMEYNLVGV